MISPTKNNPKKNKQRKSNRSEKKSATKKLSKSECLKKNYESGIYPYDKPLSTAEYEATKVALQAELMKVQRWVQDTDQHILALFEGRDAAGKGGTIKRLMEHLNPRNARVVALEKPTNYEQGQWYFQRYITHLPSSGQMVFFDRSWYNRAGVERVMGFCTPDKYEQFLKHCPLLEKMLVESGITLLKYWFSVSRNEQERRFLARETNPLKQWKLSPVDREALKRWDEYTAAKRAMFKHTNRPDTPWIIIKSDDKKRARINCLRHFLTTLDYPDKDPAIVGKPDKKIVLPAAKIFKNK